MAATLLLNVRQALIQFGDKVLFEDLSFTICERDKICLVGKNGAGKTTLMNIITGRRDVDGGDRWQLQGSTIGYLQQDVEFKPKQTIQEYVFEALNNQDGSHDYKIERVIEPLQLDPHQPMGQLSGGQLRRAALAKALVEEPDILLLDEPTNHLDLDIIEWLEDYLKAYRGAVICISHDKTFLANISDKVFWLDRGRLKICPRGFDFFDEWSTMILEQEERELHNRQKVLDQEVEWASRGVKARRKRNVRRVELMKTERDKLRVDKNALKRMLAKIEIEPMETAEAASRIAIDFWNVSKTYMDEGREKTILEKFYLRILRGERIGVLGKNGSGKTTFLKLLVGELTPDTGKVKLARDLTWSYFDQNRRDLQGDHSLHRVLSPNGSDYIDVMGKDRHVCGYLKDFLFDPKMVNHPVSTLSGGQKNRLLLARILANPGGLLILDEPTNDLDMETLDMLEEILASYTGTLIVVSHDRDFLEQTVTKILAFEGNGKIDAVVGGYKDYAAKRAQQAATAAKPSATASSAPGTNTVPRPTTSPVTSAKTSVAKLTYIQQYELEQLPQSIHALEIELVTLEKGLADPDLYTRDADEWRRVSKAHAAAKAKLKTSEERWLELEETRLALERQASVQ